jgi:hypothetical protein
MIFDNRKEKLPPRKLCACATVSQTLFVDFMNFGKGRIRRFVLPFFAEFPIDFVMNLPHPEFQILRLCVRKFLVISTQTCTAISARENIG